MDSSDDLRETSDTVSGELFDLSIPTFNNEFGYEQLTYTMRYGIYLPIKKYRQELQTILKNDGPPDDKSAKRQNRLSFLLACERIDQTRDLFPYFCCYINGGGSNPDWNFGQYRNQDLIINVAGGNIITIYAQLIMNMVDVFILSINNVHGDPYPYDQWNIADNHYQPAKVYPAAEAYKNYLFSIRDFRNFSRRDYQLLNSSFNQLTYTNKLLLTEYENYSSLSKEQIWFAIVKHIMTFHHDRSPLSAWDITALVAKSPPSDFDFKLTLNINPTDRDSGNTYDDYDEDYAPVDELIREIDSLMQKDSGPAGFMLLRAKTYIVCKHKGHKDYTSKQIKAFRHDCAKRLGKWCYSLYPQTVQHEYLSKVPQDSDAYKFLKYLLDKKDIISQATRYNIDEIVKYFLDGSYQPTNRDGETIELVPAQDNSTESVIAYLNRTSFNLNKFIQLWLSKRLVHQAGYKQDNGIRDGITYEDYCKLFLSLNNILYNERRIIPRLSTDILITFLNDPRYKTEEVLDSLIKTMATAKEQDCSMPAAEAVLAPSNKAFSNGLKTCKQILESLQFDLSQPQKADLGDDDDAEDDGWMTGLPDGIRITINAIESDTISPDTRMDQLEQIMDNLIIHNRDPELQAEYVPLVRSGGKKNKKTKMTRKKNKKVKMTRKKNKKTKTNRKQNKKHKKHKKKYTKKYKIIKFNLVKPRMTRKK